jgi:hypothetical protein
LSLWEFNFATTTTRGVPGTGASQLTITGNLDLSDVGTRTIAIFSDGSLSTTGAITYTYTIATMAGTTGTFNPANFNFVAGNFGGFVGMSTVADPGNMLVVTFRPVPEPATALLGCAAGALIAGVSANRAKRSRAIPSPRG